MLRHARPPPGFKATQASAFGLGRNPKSPSRKSSTPRSAISDVRAASSVELFKWLQEAGTPTLNVDVESIDVDGKVIGTTVAKCALSPGDLAIRVPEHLVVTLDRVFEDDSLAELLTTNKLSELACLTLYMMYEKKQGFQSFWHPYIKELDRQRARGQQGVESPILWPDEEVGRLLQGSPVVEEVRDRKAGILQEYEECDTVWYLAGSLFNKYPYDIPTEAFSSKLFMQAFSAMQACVVHLQNVPLSKRFALVPLGPPLLSYSSQSKAMLKYNVDSQSVDLVVDRSYEPGDPVYAWCGPQSNVRLLINYGIVDEGNPYDDQQVTATLGQSDPLFARKRQVLAEHGLATQQVFRLQQGKPLPETLMPFMRLANAQEEHILHKIGFTNAGAPVDGVSEHAILKQLACYFQFRLGQYQNSIEEDTMIISSPNSSPREKVAARLLRIEKNILEAAFQEILSKPESPGLEDLHDCAFSNIAVRLK